MQTAMDSINNVVEITGNNDYFIKYEKIENPKRMTRYKILDFNLPKPSCFRKEDNGKIFQCVGWGSQTKTFVLKRIGLEQYTTNAYFSIGKRITQFTKNLIELFFESIEGKKIETQAIQSIWREEKEDSEKSKESKKTKETDYTEIIFKAEKYFIKLAKTPKCYRENLFILVDFKLPLSNHAREIGMSIYSAPAQTIPPSSVIIEGEILSSICTVTGVSKNRTYRKKGSYISDSTADIWEKEIFILQKYLSQKDNAAAIWEKEISTLQKYLSQKETISIRKKEEAPTPIFIKKKEEEQAPIVFEEKKASEEFEEDIITFKAGKYFIEFIKKPNHIMYPYLLTNFKLPPKISAEKIGLEISHSVPKNPQKKCSICIRRKKGNLYRKIGELFTKANLFYWKQQMEFLNNELLKRNLKDVDDHHCLYISLPEENIPEEKKENNPSSEIQINPPQENVSQPIKMYFISWRNGEQTVLYKTFDKQKALIVEQQLRELINKQIFKDQINKIGKLELKEIDFVEESSTKAIEEKFSSLIKKAVISIIKETE